MGRIGSVDRGLVFAATMLRTVMLFVLSALMRTVLLLVLSKMALGRGTNPSFQRQLTLRRHAACRVGRVFVSPSVGIFAKAERR